MSGGKIVPLSDDGLSVIGEMTTVYDGWEFPSDWIVECFCLESPKLTYKDGWYYLTSAQGGTAGPPTSHMTVSARSKTPFGPWENNPYNPIIRNTRRDSKWVSTGHGTLVDSPDGKWWIIFHGYESKNRTIGRQTLLLPIEWTEDGWFRVPNGAEVDLPLVKPKGKSVEHGMQLSDDFRGSNLGSQWSTIQNYDRSKFTVFDESLNIKCDGEFPNQVYPLVLMPQNNFYEIQAEITAPKGTEGGVLFYFNSNYYAGMSLEDGNVYLLSSKGGKTRYAEGLGKSVWLKIVNDHHDLLCYWSVDGEEWIRADFVRDLSGFHHNALSDWGVLRPGLFGSGKGVVQVKYFKYLGLE
jgi:beta-xylosidase